MNEVYVNMPISDYYGWGVCGKNLVRELDMRVNVRFVDEGFITDLRSPEDKDMAKALKVEIDGDVDAPFIHCISRDDGNRITEEMKGMFYPSSNYKGKPDIGYIFSEQNYYLEEHLEEMKKLDYVVAGSKWNAQMLKDFGVDALAIPQGVDKEIFYPGKVEKQPFLKDKFVIFSGGKYEYRKAQDLVVYAVRKFQQGRPDVYLMTAWGNLFRADKNYERELLGIANVMRANLCRQDEMANILNQCDIGLFPNRCEGGTNLVMMECMATGMPVIANDSTGQADVIDDEYAFRINGGDLELVQQMVEKLEYAYANRDVIKEMGEKASKAMDNFSWGIMADRFLELCNGTFNKAERENTKALQGT
jgi:glycosyltransferase involved in cell wall biosynthesis